MDIEQAIAWVARADESRRKGDRAGEIEVLGRAAAVYSLIEDLPESARRGYADTCRRLGDALFAAGRLPAAMQALQEAADVYGSLPDPTESAECARRIREGVEALRRRPAERLYLLIARYEREITRLAEQADTEAAQGECEFHIASIFQRSERFAESAERYESALALFRRAADTELNQAHCLHRLADLYADELADEERAFQLFREAARLYAVCEQPSNGRQVNRSLCERRMKELTTPIRDMYI